MRITKLISAFAAVMLLAACASDDDAAMDDTAGATGSAAGTGTAAPTTAVTLSPQEGAVSLMQTSLESAQGQGSQAAS